MKSEYHYQLGDTIKTVTVESDGDYFLVTIGETTYRVAADLVTPNCLSLTIDDRQQQLYLARAGQRCFVAVAGQSWRFDRLSNRSHRRKPMAGVASSGLEATMPGLILAVSVAEGDQVEPGQTLVLMEAMKMELRVTAPYPGRVSRIHCLTGQVVERGQLLVEVEAVQDNDQ